MTTTLMVFAAGAALGSTSTFAVQVTVPTFACTAASGPAFDAAAVKVVEEAFALPASVTVAATALLQTIPAWTITGFFAESHAETQKVAVSPCFITT